MDGDDGPNRLRTFLLGGLVGASAVLAAIRRHRTAASSRPSGLAAFEDAPCYHETREAEARVRQSG